MFPFFELNLKFIGWNFSGKFSTISFSLGVCWNFLCSLADSLDDSKAGTFGTTGSVGAESEKSGAEISWTVGELDVFEVETFGTLTGCGRTPPPFSPFVGKIPDSFHSSNLPLKISVCEIWLALKKGNIHGDI